VVAELALVHGLSGQPPAGAAGRHLGVDRPHRGPEVREVRPSSGGTVVRAGSKSNAWAATCPINPGSKFDVPIVALEVTPSCAH
jgi:hypothetical protein